MIAFEKLGNIGRQSVYLIAVFVANVVTYTNLIHHFYVVREMDEVHLLFSKMEEEEVLPNVVTYSNMINCVCQERKFLEAMKCYHRSLKDGFHHI